MWGINMLFVVGGNGGNAGANAIYNYCKEHDVHCAVVGVPKSIDNDILLVRALADYPYDADIERETDSMDSFRSIAALVLRQQWTKLNGHCWRRKSKPPVPDTALDW